MSELIYELTIVDKDESAEYSVESKNTELIHDFLFHHDSEEASVTLRYGAKEDFTNTQNLTVITDVEEIYKFLES